MNTVLHTVTNVGDWQGDTLRRIDERLENTGSLPVRLNWDGIEMDDPDHFTDAGAHVFASRLAEEVAPHVQTPTIHILTDSTVDYNDWSMEGEYDQKSSHTIIRAFHDRGISATVDAVGGSGFVAGAKYNKHFRTRLSRHMTTVHAPTTILLMGGWNDAFSGHSVTLILDCITSCVNIAMHGVRPRQPPP